MSTVPALPTALKGVKWLLRHPEVIDSPFWILYDYISRQDPATELLWRKVYVTYNRATPTATTEDAAVFTLNIANITGGQLDGTWTAADYTTCDNAIQELLSSLTSLIATTHTMRDVRYYQAQFNPDLPIGANIWKPGDAGTPPKRFAKMGPPAHIFIPTGANGSATTSLPYQVAASVTFKTPAPKHWGRCYLPGLGVIDISGSTFGRFGSGTIQTLANAFAEFYDDLGNADFQLVVPTTQQDGKYATGLSGVTSIVVDDIPDVIRRRRPKQAGQRATGIPTP